MAKDDFEALLGRMPEIAEAVNAFESESIQREALRTLVESFMGSPAAAPAAPGQPQGGNPEAIAKEKSTRKKKSSGRSSAYAPKLIKTLDLNPKGRMSFREFVDEKQPKSNEDKYAVIVYYLQHELEISGITLDHIATTFRLTPEWKEPRNVQSGITTAASRKGTIDTRDYDDLRTTPHGRNFVEHELPPKKAK